MTDLKGKPESIAILKGMVKDVTLGVRKVREVVRDTPICDCGPHTEELTSLLRNAEEHLSNAFGRLSEVRAHMALAESSIRDYIEADAKQRLFHNARYAGRQARDTKGQN